jgi:hypothetical protein
MSIPVLHKDNTAPEKTTYIPFGKSPWKEELHIMKTADGTYIQQFYPLYNCFTQIPYSLYINTPENDIAKEKVVPINDLGTTRYLLKKPLLVEISQNDGEYKVVFDPLELYSFNVIKEEALDEIIEDIIDLCDTILCADDSTLGKKPRIWKKILNEYIFEYE